MQFVIENLPGVSFEATYDPATSMVTLVGTAVTGETLRASIYHGALPEDPGPNYVTLDPPAEEPAP